MSGTYAKASWHDDNIVLVDGHWTVVPESTWGTPHPPYDDRWKSNSSTIIVLIAALRESRLPATILSAFDNAAVPERIRVGVVQQVSVHSNETDSIRWAFRLVSLTVFFSFSCPFLCFSFLVLI